MIPQILYTRVFHIMIAVFLSVAIVNIFNIPRGYWVGMTVMIVYGPFSPGAVFAKFKQRIIGTTIGLLFAFLILKTVRVIPELIYLIPGVAFIGFYLMEKNYLYACIIITVAVMLLFDYIHLAATGPEQLYMDRIMATVIGLAIVLFTETIFQNSRVTQRLVHYHLRKSVKAYIKHLEMMLSVLSDKHVQRMDLTALHEMMNFRSQLEKYLGDVKLVSSHYAVMNEELKETLSVLRLTVGNLAFLIQNFRVDLCQSEHDLNFCKRTLESLINQFHELECSNFRKIEVSERDNDSARMRIFLESVKKVHGMCENLNRFYRSSV